MIALKFQAGFWSQPILFRHLTQVPTETQLLWVVNWKTQCTSNEASSHFFFKALILNLYAFSASLSVKMNKTLSISFSLILASLELVESQRHGSKHCWDSRPSGTTTNSTHSHNLRLNLKHHFGHRFARKRLTNENSLSETKTLQYLTQT